MKLNKLKTLRIPVLALAFVLLVAFAAQAANPVADSDTGLTFRFGDPNYTDTPPECYMTFTQRSDGYYDALYVNGSSTYYPDILALYITETDGSALDITSMASNSVGNVAFREYTGTAYTDYVSPTDEDEGFYTIKINSADYITITANGETTRIYFSTPNSPTAGGGTNPTDVLSYLPIGQYATGSGWGSSSGKFTGGYSSTGVSLGAFGGYIEFYFENGITDDSLNPYGVDFIVYGNAFSGNPEAGAVQVSEDGTTWYELAGSLYYQGYEYYFNPNKISNNKFIDVYEGTLNNTTVSFFLNTSDIEVTLGDDGPYTFTASTSWFPELDTSETPHYPMEGSHDNSGSNVEVDALTDYLLSFTGITAVQDLETNVSYAFGYVDVTPNGSSYGTAVNPYETFTSSKTGGDGFDLAWAVNISTGLPVDLSSKSIHYVRVYTAALDNSIFGETSTEVCGIYVTDNQATSSVGTTAAPSVVIEEAGNQIYNSVKFFL